MKNHLTFAGLATLLLLGIAAASIAEASRAIAPIAYGKALFDAEQVSALNSEWTVMGVRGRSMEPYFGENSVLVVGPAEIAVVRPGMIVIFEDGEGDLVSHKVMEVTEEGLRTMGYRNLRPDPELVTARNLRGVVIAAFHSRGGPQGEVYASNGRLLPTVYGKRY